VHSENLFKPFSLLTRDVTSAFLESETQVNQSLVFPTLQAVQGLELPPASEM
jgi:hypothetical protein